MSIIIIEDIIKAYREADATPFRTSLTKYSEGHIFDEDQSVRWNKEEVARKNAEYEADDKRCKKLRNDAYNKATELAVQYVIQETGLTAEKASILFSFVWDNCYSCSCDLFNKLDELIELYNKLR